MVARGGSRCARTRDRRSARRADGAPSAPYRGHVAICAAAFVSKLQRRSKGTRDIAAPERCCRQARPRLRIRGVAPHRYGSITRAVGRRKVLSFGTIGRNAERISILAPAICARTGIPFRRCPARELSAWHYPAGRHRIRRRVSLTRCQRKPSPLRCRPGLPIRGTRTALVAHQRSLASSGACRALRLVRIRQELLGIRYGRSRFDRITVV